MKNFIPIFFLLAFVSCEIIPDLERDNPLDANNDSNLSLEKTILEIKDIYVASRPNSVMGNDVNQTIFPGDEVYLELQISNNGKFDAEKLRATLTGTSQFATIVPISTGFYISFHGGAVETILKGRSGFGLITNGSSEISAPNSNSYVCHLIISPIAPSNISIPFSLNIKDIRNNEWQLPFEIYIN
jgi:hypothetical protein